MSFSYSDWLAGFGYNQPEDNDYWLGHDMDSDYAGIPSFLEEQKRAVARAEEILKEAR